MSRRATTVLLVAAVMATMAPSVGAGPRTTDTTREPLPSPWLDAVGPQAVIDQDEPLPEPAYVPNRLLVKFAPGVSAEVKADIHAANGAQVVGEIPGLGIQILRLYDDTLTTASAYQSRSEVVFAEPDYIAAIAPAPAGALSAAPAAPASTEPNDTLYPQQWHHDRIESDRAWDYSHGDDVTIAVVDTGVECTHADLSGKCVAGYDYANRDNDPSDDHGHGTHVAGICAAVTNNRTGVAGAGWNARVMPMKALDSTGNGGHSAIASAITWATDHGADVINMSLGGFFTSNTLRAAVEYAYDRDVVVVAAAGNEGSSNPSYPAAYNGVIAVAATTQADARASFSNYGNHIDVAAPGVGIMSTVRRGGYQAWAGTSMAAPIVSGIAALLLAQDPTRDPDAVEQILERTVDDLGTPGFDQYYGWGRINAGSALAYDPEGGGVPTPSPSVTLPPPTSKPPTVTPLPPSVFASQVEDLINLERAAVGRPPLSADPALRQASGRHSADMAGHALCQHTGSDGSTPDSRMRDAGYAAPYGEIVACGQTSPATVVETWMSSPPHQALILCAGCTEIGAGYGASDSGWGHYWTVTFGAEPTAGTATPTLAVPQTPSVTPIATTPTPTVEVPTPTRDPDTTDLELAPGAGRIGWVVSTEPYVNHFDSADTYTGTYDGKVYHGAMQFDLDTVPVGARVRYARLEMIGRSVRYRGTSGTWSVNLLTTESDGNFASHGYNAIHGASIESTLLPLLGVIDLDTGRNNTFSFTASQLALLSSRIDGARKISFRLDGPTSGSSTNLFTWDTGRTLESLYGSPKLVISYGMEDPTVTPTDTPAPTDIPSASETPVEPTEGPTPTATDTATPTETPLTPTATATAPEPPPTHTPTATTVAPIENPVELRPGPAYVGWVRDSEPGNHFGDESIFSGYSDSRVYVGAIQFDMSAVPPGADIRRAQLTLTGQSNRYLSARGNGAWRVRLLDPQVDAGWPNHSFNEIAGASVFATLQPVLAQYDLGVGSQNVFEFSAIILQELEWRAATTGRVSFRIEGPTGSLNNVFDWESGYGVGSRNPPVLSLVYGPPNGSEPEPTPQPEYVEKLQGMVDAINRERRAAGVGEVTANDALRRAAELHNFDMTFHDFFSHTGSDGSTVASRVQRAGYQAAFVEQILAARSSDPEIVLGAWMSRAQRDAVLRAEVTEIGVAYSQHPGATYYHYWTVVFARSSGG